MRKRSWFSCFFFFAFAVSLVHSSIPHTHPEKKDKPVVSGTDTNSHAHSGHDHHSHGHDEESSLPVFAHFSNADFIGNSKYEFSAKEKFVIQDIEPVIISVKQREDLKKEFPFPRPREHPASRSRSSQSLRAPPLFS